MNSILVFSQAHQALVWVLFLAPVFLVMWRGLILDTRAEYYGEDSQYGWLLMLGFMPVVNIAVAVICTTRTVAEYRSSAGLGVAAWW